MHWGMPVIKGEKFVLTKWFREKQYQFWKRFDAARIWAKLHGGDIHYFFTNVRGSND
jgi:hypothetical protein